MALGMVLHTLRVPRGPVSEFTRFLQSGVREVAGPRFEFWYHPLACRSTAWLMSPTVLRVAGYRCYFFSREEQRPHVHVQHPTGKAKIWLEPNVEVAKNAGLSAVRLATAQRLVEEHRVEIRAAWKEYFGR